MIDLTHHLERFLLQSVEFIINGKTIRKGKLKVFNFKQYFIKFVIQTDNGDTKIYDVLYPFKIINKPDQCIFEYRLSSFTQQDYDSFYKIKTITKDKVLPTYDNFLILKSLSANL